MNLLRIAARVTATALALGAGALVLGAAPATSLAAPPSSGYTLFGDATLVHPGENSPTAVQLVWSPSQPFGGVDFTIPAGLTVSQLSMLSTDYKMTQGVCSQGSPRFQINVDGHNVFVYLGPQTPSVNPCAGATFSSSTNVISATSEVDASQLGNGFETWSAFQAQHGGDVVTGIQLVVDGFTTPDITAQFDNAQINGQLVTYESAASCKDGGWLQFTTAPGPFANQGACVSYFATVGN